MCAGVRRRAGAAGQRRTLRLPKVDLIRSLTGIGKERSSTEQAGLNETALRARSTDPAGVTFAVSWPSSREVLTGPCEFPTLSLVHFHRVQFRVDDPGPRGRRSARTAFASRPRRSCGCWVRRSRSPGQVRHGPDPRGFQPVHSTPTRHRARRRPRQWARRRGARRTPRRAGGSRRKSSNAVAKRREIRWCRSAWRGRHVVLSVNQLVPPPVVREQQVVVVGQLGRRNFCRLHLVLPAHGAISHRGRRKPPCVGATPHGWRTRT